MQRQRALLPDIRLQTRAVYFDTGDLEGTQPACALEKFDIRILERVNRNPSGAPLMTSVGFARRLRATFSLQAAERIRDQAYEPIDAEQVAESTFSVTPSRVRAPFETAYQLVSARLIRCKQCEHALDARVFEQLVCAQPETRIYEFSEH